MGLFERMGRVFKANINNMISKAEDPEVMLDELIKEMSQQLIEAKKTAASAIADEKRIERALNEERKKSQEWENRAVMAVRAADTDPTQKEHYEKLAREALVQKQSVDALVQTYEQQWSTQHQGVETLKTSLKTLNQRIEEARRKKNMLISRAKRADAQKKINEQLHSFTDNSAFEAFERMAQKVDELEVQAAAMDDMSESAAESSLESEFRTLELTSGISGQDALSDLRAKMNSMDRLENKNASASEDTAHDTAQADTVDESSNEQSEDMKPEDMELNDMMSELRKKMDKTD